MKQYAQIINDKVNLIIIEDNKVEEIRATGVIIIDITNISPQPQTGWFYDSKTEIFSEPPIPKLITIISNITFWDRFTEIEQESLIGSANKKIKKFLYELRLRTSIDLSAEKLISTINALENTGIIGIGRANKILG